MIKDLKKRFTELSGLLPILDDVILYAHDNGALTELMKSERGNILTARHTEFWTNAVRIAERLGDT